MIKQIYKLIAVILGVAVITALMCMSAGAASASIRFWDPTATVGSNVTVVVDVEHVTGLNVVIC